MFRWRSPSVKRIGIISIGSLSDEGLTARRCGGWRAHELIARMMGGNAALQFGVVLAELAPG